MHFRNLLLCTFFVLVLSSSVFTQTILPDSTIQKLKLGVQGFKDRFHAPGIVVAIIHDQDIIFGEALGYTDLEGKVPATIDSKFPSQSVTKTFTATMLMQLVERKVVSLDDAVQRYLPEYRGAVSLFQLATHTSGLPRNSPADIGFARAVDKWMIGNAGDAELKPSAKTAFLGSLKHIETEYPPYELMHYGNRHYSNLGYSMLGIALERAARTDYTKYVMGQICRPLQMNNSGFITSPSDYTHIAKGYYYADNTQSVKRTPNFIPESAVHAGGMYSTAKDLARYISFQFRTDAAAGNVLSETKRAMMQAFNIGWKPDHPFVLHEGAMLGDRCVIAFSKQLKLGWIVLTNISDVNFSPVNRYISELIIPVFNKKNAVEHSLLAGTYELKGGYGALTISLKNDTLYSSWMSDLLPGMPMESLGNNRFQVRTKGNYSIGYEFLTDESNRRVILNMSQLMWIKRQ
jgi:CubicO group peptidase (beta-lactamase class C family)